MRKILLVEDDPFLVDMYKTRLEKEGFKVDVVKSGNDFFDALSRVSPELILLDIILPYVDGWEILKELKKKEEYKNTKVIVLSNLSQREDIEKSKKLGADMFLVKAHFTPSEIVEKIKEII